MYFGTRTSHLRATLSVAALEAKTFWIFRPRFGQIHANGADVVGVVLEGMGQLMWFFFGLECPIFKQPGFYGSPTKFKSKSNDRAREDCCRPRRIWSPGTRGGLRATERRASAASAQRLGGRRGPDFETSVQAC